MDEQILVGTPKEITALRILGGFIMDDIQTICFDDADVIVTSDMVQRNLLNLLKPEQQVVFATATNISKTSRHIMEMAERMAITDENEIFDTIATRFIKCNDFDEKFDRLRIIIDGFRRKHKTEKIFIFCNVSVIFKNVITKAYLKKIIISIIFLFRKKVQSTYYSSDYSLEILKHWR